MSVIKRFLFNHFISAVHKAGWYWILLYCMYMEINKRDAHLAKYFSPPNFKKKYRSRGCNWPWFSNSSVLNMNKVGFCNKSSVVRDPITQLEIIYPKAGLWTRDYLTCLRDDIRGESFHWFSKNVLFVVWLVKWPINWRKTRGKKITDEN